MRIISQFSDFYDGVQATAQDTSVRFIRSCSLRKIIVPGIPWNEPDPKNNKPIGSFERSISLWPHNYPSNIDFIQCFIILGPKCYTIWIDSVALRKAIRDDHTFKELINPKQEFGFFDFDSNIENVYKKHIDIFKFNKDYNSISEFEIVLQKANRKFTKNGWIETKGNSSKNSKKWKSFFKDDTTENLYNQSLEKFLQRDFTDICMEFETPVLLLIPLNSLFSSHDYNKDWIKNFDFMQEKIETNIIAILNPCLKLFGFQHVVDPFTVFQEISMFIGGRMPGAQSPMATISDKSQIRKKGFDEKYGFRTRPTKQK